MLCIGNFSAIKMNFKTKVFSFFIPLLCLILLSPLFISVYAQKSNNEKKTGYLFGGSVDITNNGISLLPSFSLGRPAAILDMKVGRKLTFEPQFRTGLDGKPWSFIFWWRYRFMQEKKFNIRVGAHPAVLFRTQQVVSNGVPKTVQESLRYLAMEIVPNYQLSKNVSIGMYYLKGHGLQDDAVVNSDFITFNANFSHITLVDKFYLKLHPQLYYLRMDEQDGFYATATIGLAREGFPVFIQSIVNQPFESDITGGQDFIWNISLIYAFSNNYVKK